MTKIAKFKNFIPLPTKLSPEQILSNYLNSLPDSHPLWKDIDDTFDHGTCFIDFNNAEIQNGKPGMKARDVAKKWYLSNIGLW